MKIFTISDTHGFHDQINVPEGTDMIICAGDVTNYSEVMRNEIEFNSFFNWWATLDVPHKVIVAGNHDAYAMRKYNKDKLNEVSHYLEHEYLEVAGLKIFGSPYTPTFGNWYFMKKREKLHKYWEYLQEDIDFLVTHGPAKGILDLSYDRYRNLEFCGDKSLKTAIETVNPKYHIFGHIHNNNGIENYGTRTMRNIDTVFCNSSMVEDGRFDLGIVNSGHIINI